MLAKTTGSEVKKEGGRMSMNLSASKKPPASISRISLFMMVCISDDSPAAPVVIESSGSIFANISVYFGTRRSMM